MQEVFMEKRLHLESSPKRGTGPRTENGKQRSSRNSIKHGIFSDVPFLRGERRETFESLLRGLHLSIDPVGQLEELLVEKLAMLTWRYRRLLVAENAELTKNTEFLESDECEREALEAERIGISSSTSINGGLMSNIANGDVLDRCLEYLAVLLERIRVNGFNVNGDVEILERLYGDRPQLNETLREFYAVWHDTSKVPEAERQLRGYDDPEQCEKNALIYISEEIRILKAYKKARESNKSERTKLEILARNIPNTSALDQLLRYEASLERSFDRTLNQLERLQRMRRGQPVTPRIDVNIVS
jgi:hypothetical protein